MFCGEQNILEFQMFNVKENLVTVFFLKKLHMKASYYHTHQREDKKATPGDKLQGVGTQHFFPNN